MKCLNRLKMVVLFIAIAISVKPLDALWQAPLIYTVQDSKKPSVGILYITNNNKNGFNAHVVYNQRKQEKSVYVAPAQTVAVEIQGIGPVAVDGVFYNFSDNPERQFGTDGNCPLVTSVNGIREGKCHVDAIGSMIAG